MRKKMLLVCFVVLFISSNAFAHPPRDVELSYTFASQMLHIEMSHQTHDPREDYVRKIVITKNNGKAMTEYYNIQLNTMKFEEDIKISAQAGDRISIKAYSKEGGTKEAEIVVEKMQEDQEIDEIEEMVEEAKPVEQIKKDSRY